jgi:hypothetical protein
MNNNRVVDTGSIPPQKVPALPVGANNIYQAGMITAQKDAASLNQLIGGKKKHKKNKKYRYKGGSSQAVILAPSVPSYAAPGTQGNYTALAKLGLDVQNAGVYDTTKTQSQVAGISTEQNKIYNGKGGSSVHWGCLSGGKKSKCNKSKKKRSYKCKKSRCKRKHRKTCKRR